MTPSEADVWAAMDRVIDPELDRSLAALDFVSDVAVGEGEVRVAVRLPTYWCSPNFAFLMVGDADAALRAVPGAERVRVELVDHFAGERITDAVAAGQTFQETFPDQADGELAELRRRFQRKAFLVRQEPVLRAARAALGGAGTVALRLGSGAAPTGVDAGDWAEYLRRRADLGMPEGPAELVFTDADGAALVAAGLDHYLRLSRSVRISLESNTEFCTGLLAARYDGEPGVESWQRKEVTA